MTYHNAENFPNGISFSTDICIVGAGAAGIAMAQRLAASSKKKVLLLSSGLSTDFRSPDPVKESIYQGTVGSFLNKVDPGFLTRSRLRMYGGTTNHFGYWARPLDEADLKPRPGYRDAFWPLDMAELNRYYPDANETGNFGPFNYDDLPFWENALGGKPFPPLPGDALQNAIFHAQYNEQIHDFQLRYGPQLKASQDVAVIFNANLLGLSTTPNRDHVTRFFCRSLVGGRPANHFFVDAPYYVLAQGGIEPVRILKIAGNLGDNAKGHLGRGFMVHPLITGAALVRFSGPVDMLTRNFFRDQQVKIAPPTNENEGHTLVTAPTYYMEELSATYVFNAWGSLVPTVNTMDSAQIGNFRINLGFNGTTNRAIINFNWEQVPNENSTITLDERQVDPVFGQPVVRLDWNLLEQEKRTIIRGLEFCKQYLRARDPNLLFDIVTDLSGGPENWTFAPFGPNSAALRPGDHHMGALRMSKTAADGIVNTDLRLHTVDNLYIAGCGVFPTSGYANPTLTLVALALRLADHLNGLQ